MLGCCGPSRKAQCTWFAGASTREAAGLPALEALVNARLAQCLTFPNIACDDPNHLGGSSFNFNNGIAEWFGLTGDPALQLPGDKPTVHIGCAIEGPQVVLQGSLPVPSQQAYPYSADAGVVPAFGYLFTGGGGGLRIVAMSYYGVRGIDGYGFLIKMQKSMGFVAPTVMTIQTDQIVGPQQEPLGGGNPGSQVFSTAILPACLPCFIPAPAAPFGPYIPAPVGDPKGLGFTIYPTILTWL